MEHIRQKPELSKSYNCILPRAHKWYTAQKQQACQDKNEKQKKNKYNYQSALLLLVSILL